jgi:hypothetical protein
MWGVGVYSEVGILIHPTCVLWGSGQDSGLVSLFLECYCPQTIPSQTLLYVMGSVMLLQTIIITELVFYCRQYTTDQNVLASFCIYISMQYYERPKSIPRKTPQHCNANSSKFHC